MLRKVVSRVWLMVMIYIILDVLLISSLKYYDPPLYIIITGCVAVIYRLERNQPALHKLFLSRTGVFLWGKNNSCSWLFPWNWSIVTCKWNNHIFTSKFVWVRLQSTFCLLSVGGTMGKMFRNLSCWKDRVPYSLQLNWL